MFEKNPLKVCHFKGVFVYLYHTNKQNEMRALETIIRENPELTGTEAMAIQEQDKLDDKKEYDEINKKKLDFIKDINENGGYYRGRFGLDQHWFYRVFDMHLESNGSIRMSIEKIVLFYTTEKRQVTKPHEIRLERRIEDYEDASRYNLFDEDRVTVKEWEEVNEYLNKINQFWSTIKWEL